MSRYSQLSWMQRRAMCTGESMNMIRRLGGSPTAPLVPAAASAAQRHFEAALLLRWIDASEYTLGMRGQSMRSFVSAVYPAPDFLAISVSHPTLLLPFLNCTLPRSANGRLVGIPGLRVYLWRDFMELRLLGTDNDVCARVRLHGVNRTRQQGKELLAQVTSSGPLWRTAERVSIDPAGPAVSVQWHGGPSASAMLAVLGGPSCGFRHSGYASSLWPNVRRIVFLGVGDGEPDVAEPWEAWEEIHAGQQADRDRVAMAPTRQVLVVTPEAWEDAEMRNALAAREVSTIYKLLRRKGVSQRQIAAMTGQSQSEVSEILKGRQVMAYDVLVRIADGLGVPRGYMGLTFGEGSSPDQWRRTENHG